MNHQTMRETAKNPNYVQFNINNQVRVKLTEFGREFLEEEHEVYWHRQRPGIYVPYTPPKEDEDGWSTWQLWHLMQKFGTVMYLGNAKLPFETTIELVHFN